MYLLRYANVLLRMSLAGAFVLWLCQWPVQASQSRPLPPGMSGRLYLPALSKAPFLVTGSVTKDGLPAGGIELKLPENVEPAGHTPAAILATTGADGRYYFWVPDDRLSFYSSWTVTFLPDTPLPGYIRTWSISGTQQTGNALELPTFDLGDVVLVGPGEGATVNMPITFAWHKRAAPMPSEEYQVVLDTQTNNQVSPSLSYPSEIYTMRCVSGASIAGEKALWLIQVSTQAGMGLTEARTINVGSSIACE